MITFGAGFIWATPLQTAAGVAVSNPTPLLMGVVQGVDVDIKRELKKLHGSATFPVDVAGGKSSITGKISTANIYANLFETVVFGSVGSAGKAGIVADTTGQVIGAGAVTVTPPASGAWAGDLGVIDVSTARPLARVASAPATGQYAVNDASGAYTFAAADQGKAVYINYRYSVSGVGSGARTVGINNVQMGYVPTFRLDLLQAYKGEEATLTLYSCVADGIKFGSKNDDYTIPEFGFEAYADAANRVGVWSLK